jgi:putative transposase
MKYKKIKGCHSVCNIQFHLIFCVKYRHKILSDPISIRLKEIIINIAEKYKIQIIEQETDLDHIHILFTSHPTVVLSKFINTLKTVSSRLIRKEFPEVKKKLWKNSFWSSSYFIASVGEVKLDELKKYVKSQGI